MHYHLLGSGLTLFLTWQISTFFGIFFGQFIPENINLSFIILREANWFINSFSFNVFFSYKKNKI